MSECLHIHDDEGHDIGYVCVPGPWKYLPRVHERGARTYKLVGEPTASLRIAFMRLAGAFEDDRLRILNRGDILAFDDNPYYEPHVAYEVRP